MRKGLVWIVMGCFGSEDPEPVAVTTVPSKAEALCVKLRAKYELHASRQKKYLDTYHELSQTKTNEEIWRELGPPPRVPEDCAWEEYYVVTAPFYEEGESNGR